MRGRHRPYRNHIGLGLVVGVVHVGVEGISGVVVVSCVELSDDDEGVGGTQGSAHSDLFGGGEGVGGMQASAHNELSRGGVGVGGTQGSAHSEVFVEELVSGVVGGEVVGVGVGVVEVNDVVVVVFVVALVLARLRHLPNLLQMGSFLVCTAVSEVGIEIVVEVEGGVDVVSSGGVEGVGGLQAAAHSGLPEQAVGVVGSVGVVGVGVDVEGVSFSWCVRQYSRAHACRWEFVQVGDVSLVLVGWASCLATSLSNIGNTFEVRVGVVVEVVVVGEYGVVVVDGDVVVGVDVVAQASFAAPSGGFVFVAPVAAIQKRSAPDPTHLPLVLVVLLVVGFGFGVVVLVRLLSLVGLFVRLL